jgi:hypothetical protein
VRHEVSGPVEAVLSIEPGLIVVAGQRVKVPGKAVGSVLVRPGAWVAVSGLRGPDGDIIATRLDPRPPGRVLVHGPLIQVDGVATIGSLEIRGFRGSHDQFGTYVVTSGTYESDGLHAETVDPDLLASNPPAYFGPGTKRLVLESYTRFASGSATVSGGYSAGLASGFEPPRDLTGPVIISLDAQPDGSFAVIRARGAFGLGAPAGAPSDPVSPGGERPGAGTPEPHAGPVVSPVESPGAASGVGESARLPGRVLDQPVLEATGSSGNVALSSQPVTDVGAMSESSATMTGSNSRISVQGAAQAPSSGVAGGGAAQPSVVVGSANAGGAIRAVSPHAPMASGGGGSVMRGGGVRLMGAGIARPFGNAAAAMVAPRAMGIHMRSVRIRPRG